MIVQACLNGSRAADYHPEVPRTPDQVARDGAACLRAGAAELHLHPRGIEGRESLDPAVQAATVRAVRAACPGTAFGVSTGGWIEGDALRTLACIAGWTELPDYASVNLSEPHAPAVIGLLRARGIGVEAGLATVAAAASDASRNRTTRTPPPNGNSDTSPIARAWSGPANSVT